MQTQLTSEFAHTPDGEEAKAIVRKCVHCGFCNATCPTYQLLGDELDGPRGRIYLIKQVLEGTPATRSIQLHLDRCLTCLNCQTTCPSGVEYGHLVEIGRRIVDARVERPVEEKALRWVLKEGLTSPLFGPALRAGQALRPLLPAVLRQKIPARSPRTALAVQARRHARKVLMLRGCVQPSMMPNIDAAAVRVLGRIGVEAVFASGTGCCGALRTHLSDTPGGLEDMRRNVDVWSALLNTGDFEAIIVSASACALAVKEYHHALAGDPVYAPKAARVSGLARDLSEFLPEFASALKDQVGASGAQRLAFHAPCTLQHGQGVRGTIEAHLSALGFEISGDIAESNLCCGSAGAYSVLQPLIATQLRDRKLANIGALQPACIISANVGCIQHLQSGTATPVKHWIEVLDDALLSES